MQEDFQEGRRWMLQTSFDLIVFYWKSCSSYWNHTERFLDEPLNCQFHSPSAFKNGVFEFTNVHLWVFEAVFSSVHKFFHHFAECSRHKYICLNSYMLAWKTELKTANIFSLCKAKSVRQLKMAKWINLLNKRSWHSHAETHSFTWIRMS